MLGGDSVETVWVEALPVLPGVEDDDGRGAVSEVLSQFQSLRVSRDIPLHELNTAIIQSLFGKAAGLARRRGYDGDQEGSFQKRRTN